jgi:pyridoxal phosphate enzyme (YggS family)
MSELVSVSAALDYAKVDRTCASELARYNGAVIGDMKKVRERIAQNLAVVRQRVRDAAKRSGRTAESVILIGVTKYVEPEVARALFEAGLQHLGESRPQDLWSKASALANLSVHWHLIGHLQRNKVRRTLPLVTCIHSADSLRLLEEISREAGAINRRADVLLEVNVSGDAAKHGFQPDEIESLLPQIGALPNVYVLGLMTMAGLEGGPERARRDFSALRELAERLKTRCPPRVVMNELSMGMSGDFEVAIEEGATNVRVGSALFEGIVQE